MDVYRAVYRDNRTGVWLIDYISVYIGDRIDVYRAIRRAVRRAVYRDNCTVIDYYWPIVEPS